MEAVGGNWSCLELRILLTAFNPEILSILRNILITSKLPNLQSDVVLLLLKSSIIVSISDVLNLLNINIFQQK